MKVLNIGRDKDLKIFEKGSALESRVIEYGKLVDEIHITIFTLKKRGLSLKKIEPNIFIYPTNSTSRWFFVLDAIRLGKKIILDNKFVRGESVITCQDPFECGFVGCRISKRFRLPFHLQIHTDFLSSHFKTSFFQRFRVFVAKFLLPKANGIRVVSKVISDSIKQKGIVLKYEPEILPIRIDVESIQNQVGIKDESNLRKLFPQFKFTILMASRLTNEKRICDAIVTFSKIVSKYLHTGLVIVGDGPLKKELQKMVDDLKISKNVMFLGWRDDIYMLMKTANMFLSTSEYEGYGMSLVEAGLSECPILTTNVGIAKEFLIHNKNSYVCAVGDTLCIYDGISKLIEDNSFRYDLSKNLLEDLKKHIPTKAEYNKKYIDLLKKASKI